MKKFLIYTLQLAFLVCGLSFVVTSPAGADFGSSILSFNVGQGFGPDSTFYSNLGGPGETFIGCDGAYSYDHYGAPGLMYHTATSGVAYAYASQASVGADFSGSLHIYGDYSAPMMGGAADTYFWDHFKVGAGTSGLPYATPVNIILHVTLYGSVSFNGQNLSWGNAGNMRYDVQLWDSRLNSPSPDSRYLLDEVSYPLFGTQIWYGGGLQVVIKDWTMTVPTYVGDDIYIQDQMVMQFGAAIYQGEQNFNDAMSFTDTGTARLGYAPGFENISIVSDSGATILPAVPVPGTVFLLGPGLVGLAAIRRRFKK